MEVERLCYGVGGATAVQAFNLMVHTVVVAEKSIHWLLFLVGSVPNCAVALCDLLKAENRFPFSDLNKVSSPDAECKESGETDDDSDDDDDPDASDDSDDDMEDSSGEDDDDEQGDADSESDNSDDEDEDDNDDDDDDSDEDDDEDDDEDEEEENQPPFKKTK